MRDNPTVTISYPETIAVAPANRPIVATVRVPGSKSITNRALLIAGLAEGRTTIEGALFSDDTHYLSAALRALGCTVAEDPVSERFVVDGAGGPFPATAADLFVGNAGTAMRFLVGVLPLGRGRFRVDGVGRMRERPIGPLIDGLRQLGVNVRAEFANDCPPVVIEANGVRGGRVKMAGARSSQYFSALLMAAPLTAHGIQIEVDGELVSRPFIDLTLAVMAGVWRSRPPRGLSHHWCAGRAALPRADLSRRAGCDGGIVLFRRCRGHGWDGHRRRAD
ncbi:MAG: hypothetical protein KatS3mg060_3223 [Dehalococcoidia bacterium]|nr:MAG: hypothetical protein KatS3mg060_3223 [Dehalococcoidia bacterium]